MNKRELWLRLRHYHFDHLVPSSLWDDIRARFGGPDASTRAFADKLARKLGWKRSFACRALAEYKKFIYLGIVSDFVVTPSRVIDQVWHEHLLFSRGYRAFCSEVIEYPFDHEPELTPLTDQTATFRAQYLDTLELYRAEFGYDPPGDIWFDPKFDELAAAANGSSQRKRQPALQGDSVLVYADEAPLHAAFEGDAQALAYDGFEFGGGDGGGAGASGDWSDSDGYSSDAGGDGGSDGRSSCSSCSSGCGGGD